MASEHNNHNNDALEMGRWGCKEIEMGEGSGKRRRGRRGRRKRMRRKRMRKSSVVNSCRQRNH